MYKKLIGLIVCYFFGITFMGSASAYENLPNTDDQGCDIFVDDGFGSFDGILIDSDLNNSLTSLHGTDGLKTLGDYIYYNFDWKRGAATTSHGVIETGFGDCWGLTDFSKEVLEANGYTVKVQQLKTKESNNHRRLLVLLDGKWVKFDPSLCTEHYN